MLAVLALGFSPFFIADGLRFWIWWQARQEKLTVKIDKVETPFLRPVVLRGVHVISAKDTAFRMELAATQAVVGLNFKTILLRTRGRALSHIAVTGLRLEIHRNETGPPFPERSWMTWQKLLPNNTTIDGLDLRIENGSTVILARGASISLSDIEAGRINIDKFTIASPIVRQTFSGLHGATRWQENHVTFAGIRLTGGLDIQSIKVDLSHLGKMRLGLEFDLDAFGGKIRGNISNEWRSRSSNWNIAGSATDISLGQTAEAIGFTDRIAGTLHAGKFTFRGDLRDPAHATASFWTELTAPTWRNRQADVIMLGAAIYNHQIDVQQLYIKQQKNELTLHGESPLPTNWADWLGSEFHADISAAIKDVGGFARLLTGSAGDYAGDIVVDGTINSRARKLGGQLSVVGNSLRIFNSPVDLFTARLNLVDNVVELSGFDLKRGGDFLTGEGKIDISHPENRVGSFDVAVHNVADYWPSSHLNASLNAHLNLAGSVVSFDQLRLSALAFGGNVDLGDPKNVAAALTPLTPIAAKIIPGANDCVDALQIIPPIKKPDASTALINQVELTGDLLGGVRGVTLKTNQGEKTYRASCADAPNHVLQIGALGQSR